MIKQSITFRGKELSIESGLLANRANSSVCVKYGNNIILATVTIDKNSSSSTFFPLTVDVIENFYSTGKIPGSFHRREGKPSTNAILTSRVIDRSIRPLFDKNFRHGVHVVINILSYDKNTSLDLLGILGASSALLISEAPFEKAISGIDVGLKNKTPISGSNSPLSLLVSSTEDNIIMVEAEALEIEESVVIDAIQYAFKESQELISLQKDFASKFVVNKIVVEEKESTLSDDVKNKLISVIESNLSKIELTEAVEKEARELLEDSFEDHYFEIKDLIRDEIRKRMLSGRKRVDNREGKDIRNIDVDIDFLPMAHGSALFTRGTTQSLGTTTLGSVNDQKIIDNLEEDSKQKFFLHYNFHSFSTGNTSFLRAPSRREIGHGKLAEKSIRNLLEEDFPYTVRVVSDILSSNGSSSMASVCSASLSLMASGVPLKSPVAGIAMGLVDDMILSDITAIEDFVGDIDFKVAGTKKGITALQMDVKSTSLDSSLLFSALDQAKEGRLHILGIMNKAIDKSKEDLPDNVPRYAKIKVPVDKINLVIGSGGKTIRGIVEATKAEIDIDDFGNISIFADTNDMIESAKSMILAVTKDLEKGDIVNGTIIKLIPVGAIVALPKKQSGLLHISEFTKDRTKDIKEFVKEGEAIKVKIENIDLENRKIRLSKQ